MRRALWLCSTIRNPISMQWSLYYWDIDYTKDNRFILDRTLLPIYECHENCSCHDRNCGNRAFSKSLSNLPHVRISPTAQKGFGVFAEEVIPQGTIILEYVGEVLRRAVAEDRIRRGSNLYPLRLPQLHAGSSRKLCKRGFSRRMGMVRKKHETWWLILYDTFLRLDANCDPFVGCCNRPTDYESSLFLSW